MTRTRAPGALTSAVRAALAEAGDPERAAGQQAYMRSTMPFRGVTAPALRRVLRPLLADESLRPADRAAWTATVLELWDGATHREERYAALAVARHPAYEPWRDPASLAQWRHLVVTGAWWDLVDETATHLVGDVLRAEPAAVVPQLRTWAVADDLWLRRTAIISQLHSREATDTDLLAFAIGSNTEGTAFGREFFVRKAIGWALRQHARTDPAWVVRFVEQHADRLSGLSRREALKHLGG